MYFLGLGVVEDKEKAFQLYEECSKGSISQANFNLGN